MDKSMHFVPNLLVGTDWLATNLNDSEIRIVDTGSQDAYFKAHIPGALGVSHSYLKSEAHPLHIMGPEPFKRLMNSLDIGEDTTVVAYDNNRGLTAARFWWALAYYGHHKVSVLDGGWRKWVKEQRAVQTELVRYTSARASFTPRIASNLIADLDELMTAYNQSNILVWDVRSKAEYSGEVDRGNKRKGHLPGARHLEWLELVNEDDHTFKEPSQIAKLLQGAGLTPEKFIYTY